jgi:hypothetical protein
MAVQSTAKTKGTIMAQLLRAEPKKNVTFTAVSSLTNMADMFTFCQEYASHLRKHGDTASVRRNADVTALSNIGIASMELFGGMGTNPNEIKWTVVVRSILTSKFSRIKIPEGMLVDRNSDPDRYIRTSEEMLRH